MHVVIAIINAGVESTDALRSHRVLELVFPNANLARHFGRREFGLSSLKGFELSRLIGSQWDTNLDVSVVSVQTNGFGFDVTPNCRPPEFD